MTEGGAATVRRQHGVKSRLRLAWLRLSTGVKMMLILAAALAPLGAIAVLAAVETAAQNRSSRHTETRLMASSAASRLNATIGRAAVTMRATATALALNPPGISACERTLTSLTNSLGSGTRLAMFGGRGTLLCATAGFRPHAPATSETAGPGPDYHVAIDPTQASVAITIEGATGTTTAVALLSQRVLAARAALPGSTTPTLIPLTDGARHLTLSALDGASGSHTVSASTALAAGQLRLDLSAKEPPIRPVEIVSMLLPVIMLLAAATIGWLVLDQLILRPLARLQQAVAVYQPGRALLVLPLLNTPSSEIRRLSQSFQALTGTVAQHENELEQGLARQTKLTREVHHRVKNNLQVVASLINLHARGATSSETIAAYASIQRRVDALAIVHRNHFAEYEQNRGVALRPLLQELAGNLKASASANGNLSILMGIEPLHVTQDTAVAVAFLVTELVELAMLCGPTSAITIRLIGDGRGRAALSISSPALRPSDQLTHWLDARFGRVVEGLARQLRTALDRNEAEGRYSFTLAVLD